MRNCSIPAFAEDALVIFSGGQDSSICLGWALNRFSAVHTVGFTYGQRHLVEMESRQCVIKKSRVFSEYWNTKLTEDSILDLTLFGQIGETAMTSTVDITLSEQGLPNTFVPGRNLIFMTAAAALAWRKGIRHLVLGVCETDFSGYPDCRDNTVKAMQLALNMGMDSHFVIHTPLMWLTKGQSWALAEAEGGPDFVEMVRAETHTCYLGERGELHEWGYGCGTCPSCRLRAKGWTDYQQNRSNT